MITSWNDAEDDALQSLPLRAQVIYLRGIRRHMNYKTGVSGGPERRISLKMLGEIAEAFDNRQRVQPSKKEVIVSIDQLKKAGLIERVEDKDFLVFFLPKADTHQSVSGNYGTTTAQLRHANNGTVKLTDDATLTGNYGTTTAHPTMPNYGTHQESGNQEEKKEKELPSGSSKKKFIKPSLDEIRGYIEEIGVSVSPEAFFDHYESNGWLVGKAKASMKNWQASVRTWARNEKTPASGQLGPGFIGNNQRGNYDRRITQEQSAERREKFAAQYAAACGRNRADGG